MSRVRGSKRQKPFSRRGRVGFLPLSRPLSLSLSLRLPFMRGSGTLSGAGWAREEERKGESSGARREKRKKKRAGFFVKLNGRNEKLPRGARAQTLPGKPRALFLVLSFSVSGPSSSRAGQEREKEQKGGKARKAKDDEKKKRVLRRVSTSSQRPKRKPPRRAGALPGKPALSRRGDTTGGDSPAAETAQSATRRMARNFMAFGGGVEC